MENIGLGLELMIVGMSTVFLILVIVIWGGKLLITLVNRFAPEEAATPKKAAAQQTVDGTTLAILGQVVSQITGGKGKLVSAKLKD